MQAVIICGGRGKRLMPITKNIPKILAPVNGKPFIFYILEQLYKQGIKEIGTQVEYYSGLFVGSLPPVELKEAIIKSINGGATGVNFFSIKNLTEEHLKIIKSV